MSIRMRRRLWRAAMKDSEPQRRSIRDLTGSGHWPAYFESKALVYVSSCGDHPKFQAKRYPTSGCTECLAIYAEKVKGNA